MKKGVTVLMAFAILSIVLAAESRPERPARPKLEDMTKEELLSQISGQLKDGEAFEFIPILGKEKDAAGVEYYTVKTAEKGERKVEDLDKSELMQLLGRIIVVTETKEELLGEIKEYLFDEELLGLVPGLGIIKDKVRGDHFTLKLGDEPARMLDDLDKKELVRLRGMVVQARTILQSQRIQRQLDLINRSVQQNVQAAQRAQQLQSQVPKVPPAAPQTPPQVYIPPQPPRREGR